MPESCPICERESLWNSEPVDEPLEARHAFTAYDEIFMRVLQAWGERMLKP